MASLGHVAVGLAAARRHADGLRAARPSLLAYAAFSALALLPDIDVVGLRFHVAYAAEWGHRGAAHSLAIAARVGLAVACARAGARGCYALPWWRRTACSILSPMAASGSRCSGHCHTRAPSRRGDQSPSPPSEPACSRRAGST